MEKQSVNYRSGVEYRSFEDREVYRVAREFRIGMYGVARRLPDLEKFGLAGQIRRAAVSLTNNLAEGHGRFHFLDQIKFTLISRGSLEELIDDLNICEDEKYLPASEAVALKAAAWHVLKLINGYLRYLRDCKAGDSLKLHEPPPTDEPASMTWLDDIIAAHPDFFTGGHRPPNH